MILSYNDMLVSLVRVCAVIYLSIYIYNIICTCLCVGGTCGEFLEHVYMLFLIVVLIAATHC